MTYFMSILMGIIQGVAEFLPISSSGHLALFQTFFGMENMEEKYMFFTVLLHFGTLISVCMVYWRDIVDMIREFFLGIAALAGRKDTGVAPPPARRMVMLIIIATVPLFVMVFLQDAVNQLFSNSIMVSCALLATGFILFFSEREPLIISTLLCIGDTSAYPRMPLSFTDENMTLIFCPKISNCPAKNTPISKLYLPMVRCLDA